MKRSDLLVLLAILRATASPGMGQIAQLEFADKPRLVECEGQPCFRLTLNVLDSEGQPAPLEMSPEAVRQRFAILLKRSTVSEEETHQPFHLKYLQEGQETSVRNTYSIVLLDVSGSMNEELGSSGETKFTLAIQAANRYLDRMKPGIDHVAIIPFESHQVANRILQATFDNDARAAQSSLRQLPRPELTNNTALYSAIFHALEVLNGYRDQGFQTSLVVLTDGQNDIRSGDDPGLLQAEEGFSRVKQRIDGYGIQVITIGFGEKGGALDEETLRDLCWPADVNYYYAQDRDRLEKVFEVSREKLVNRLQMGFGPVAADKNQLAGRSLQLEVLYQDSGQEVRSGQVGWYGGSFFPAYEGGLETDELASFLQTADTVGARPLISRLVVLLFLSTILALFWFVIPRFVWPTVGARQASRPREADPETKDMASPGSSHRPGDASPSSDATILVPQGKPTDPETRQ